MEVTVPFSKSSVLKCSHPHENNEKPRFEIPPGWRAFSKKLHLDDG